MLRHFAGQCLKSLHNNAKKEQVPAKKEAVFDHLY